ncbi:deoxyribodipyrimidine photo-lyase [Jatrophihabitans sp. GAS493]|uniref:cryptochrome/photolyase family protein n=1 Tax=Jatrophihabitans sp. GAS493 TaxID=1907575 RepID=UPI000BB689DB|nr:deoxyribodipyrimidine photo-lyase [Jatrophihabitans sp. GAS493]
MWFRRDLRVADHPALLAAAQDGPVTALFVLDDALLRPAGAPRLAFLLQTLRALQADLSERGGQLVVRRGEPAEVVGQVAREVGAVAVHVSSDHAPYGSARDARVEAALGGIPLIRTGSPYGVTPGRVRKADGSPFKVYSAFYRRWVEHGWPAPAQTEAAGIDWAPAIKSVAIPDDPPLDPGLTLPPAGEAAAVRAWANFAAERLADYDTARDRPDQDATSHLSPHLHVGSIHPRTLLQGLGRSTSAERFRRELAWRDFYASVLHFWPASAREYFQPELAAMPYRRGKAAATALAAWQQGRTGYPIVDAGMRQLLAEGWMHNRVRMIVASFLVKDLHIEWTEGARHFMRHLIDGDLASNQHGWQWTAGSGTDASPYFRIFNPTTQGRRFDPQGDYIRRYVPQLRSFGAREIHEPGASAQGLPEGYPAPIVDHARERAVSLADYKRLRG